MNEHRVNATGRSTLARSGSRKTACAAPVRFAAAGAAYRTTTIGGGETLRIARSRAVAVGRDDRLDVENDSTIVVGGKVLIRAGQELRIDVGDSSPVLKASGDIQLRGKKISIEGSSDVHLKGNKVHTN